MAATQNTPATSSKAATPAPAADIKAVESIILRGDISGLTPEQKIAYANRLAQSVGLDPVTAPFKSIRFERTSKGQTTVKEIMYADKGTAEQLRRLHDVTIVVTQRETIDGVFYVTAQATLPSGRKDEDVGAVPLGQYENEKANAVMKAHTKAKRRVTLSILGLGVLDESELETIQQDNKFASIPPEGATTATPAAAASNVVQMPKPEVLAAPAREAPPPAAPAPQIVEAQKEPQPIWTSAQPIPLKILTALPPDVRALGNIPLDRMQEDDLELVIEAGARAYAKWGKMPGVGQRALALLKEIIGRASELLAAKQGKVAPPNEAPMDADELPPPTDADLGEVQS